MKFRPHPALDRPVDRQPDEANNSDPIGCCRQPSEFTDDRKIDYFARLDRKFELAILQLLNARRT
jgi:hypothetical protein